MKRKNTSDTLQVIFPWLMRMAWRDSRRNRLRLILFISSITLGIAALVATFSLGENVLTDIDKQSKALVGADLAVESNRPANTPSLSFLNSMGNKRSMECSFASMVYFIKNQGTRLVQVRALSGGYPFYGSLQTSPAAAGRAFQNGRYALVDKTLMLQFDAHVGDSIKIGELCFAITGILNSAPGRNGLSTTVAPPVYIPLEYLSQTGLLQKGSRISYHFYYQFDPPANVEKIVEGIRPEMEKEGLEYETAESRKRSTDRAFEDFDRFLTLISFIALLLGCIGVASSIHIYMREKIPSIAILRCLGASGTQTFLIWLIQVAGIGLVGSAIGAVLGTFVQQLLPAVLKDFLPFELSTGISWRAVGQGIILGLVISMLFALLPLLSIRKISPLNTLRLSVEPTELFRDPLKWLIYISILFFVTWFAWRQIHHWKPAILFTGSALGAFLLLAVIAGSLKWLLRRFFPSSWSYLWRQGLANLFRPNNQTLVLISTIGLSVAFIATLYFVHNILISRVALSARGDQPNIVIFDIQPGQKAGISSVLEAFQMPILQELPIVTLRMEEINGKTMAQIRQDSASRFPRRIGEGELRVTYRDSLSDSEKLVEGKLGHPVLQAGDQIAVSLEQRFADMMHLKIGDRIIFNVQGISVATQVGSIRQVDWRRMQTNFRVIFPSGVLESAPQFDVMISRVPSAAVSALFQQAIVRKFPNVSIIDLGLILGVLDDILKKIGVVIQFMAGFSMITGLIVLIASVLISKYQRIQETVLLRTLGASRKQILIITSLEYFFLGALASMTGIGLSLIASWGLAKYSFDAPFSPDWKPMVLLFLLICLITVSIGLFNSREVLNKAPLEILGSEG
jgi:putative ABC transport system permease protein